MSASKGYFLIIFWSVFVIQAFSNRIHDEMLGKSTFTRRTLNDFLKNMNELGRIEREIMGVSTEAAASTQYDFEQTALGTVVSKPWQIPYLFEGDMVLLPSQMSDTINFAKQRLAEQNGETIDPRSKRTLTSSTRLRWTTFPIPYTLSRGTNRTAILAGIQLWQDNTCLTFSENGSGRNALQFIFGSGCYSNVGMVGGVQQISIGSGCDWPAIVAHEVGHSLGYYHEQARFDRDTAVQILTQNIQSGMESQFSKQSPSSMITYGVVYDYGSVMHYDPFSFSRNNQPTIQTLDLNYMDTIGQRTGLSFNDIKKINFAYCNSTCTTNLPCQRSGYTDPKSCSQCRCPDGIGGTLCDQPLATNSQCGSLSLTATPSAQTLTQSGSANCNYLISAPTGQRVIITIDNVRFNAYSPCETTYVEIRTAADIGNTGARLCDGVNNNQVTSVSNEALVLYRSTSRSNTFSITYRSDGPPVTTTTSTTTAATTTTTQPGSTTDPTTTTTTTTAATTTTTTAVETTTTTTEAPSTWPPWTLPWTTTTRRPSTRPPWTLPWTTTTRRHRTTTRPCRPCGGGNGGGGQGGNGGGHGGHGGCDISSSSDTDDTPNVDFDAPDGSRLSLFDQKLTDVRQEAVNMLLGMVSGYEQTFEEDVQEKKDMFDNQKKELTSYLTKMEKATAPKSTPNPDSEDVESESATSDSESDGAETTESSDSEEEDRETPESRRMKRSRSANFDTVFNKLKSWI